MNPFSDSLQSAPPPVLHRGFYLSNQLIIQSAHGRYLLLHICPTYTMISCGYSIPSLAHSQCLSMNGSDIMNNSRRTGRPISYWSFQPPPPLLCSSSSLSWMAAYLLSNGLDGPTDWHWTAHWIYSGYSLLLLRQYLHSDIIVSDLPVSTFSSAGQSCVAHQLLCRLACMQYLTP